MTLEWMDATVDGTRSYHCFVQQSNGFLIIKRIDCHYDKHEVFNWICKMIIANANLESMLLVFMMVTGSLEQYLNVLMRIKTAVLSL